MRSAGRAAALFPRMRAGSSNSKRSRDGQWFKLRLKLRQTRPHPAMRVKTPSSAPRHSTRLSFCGRIAEETISQSKSSLLGRHLIH
jgi:hypothetical protein